MQRLELPEVEALTQSRQLVPSRDEAEFADFGGVDRRPRQEFWILFIASTVALFWLGGTIAFIYGYYQLDQFGLNFSLMFDYLQTRLSFIWWLVFGAFIFLPTGFIWMTALITLRSSQLNRSATELGDIALKLTKPESTATREITPLGHAVPREVRVHEQAVPAPP